MQFHSSDESTHQPQAGADHPDSELTGQMLRFAEQVDDLVSLTQQAMPGPPPQAISHPFAGRIYRVLLPGHDDAAYAKVASELARKSIWQLPEAVQPRSILDIGSGTGLRAMYLADRYPEAAMTCLEPRPNLAACLEVNLSRYAPQVELANPFSPAGFPVRYGSLRAWLEEQGRQSADVICLDAQGFELELAKELPRGMRFAAQAIIGRLHGTGDWQLLEMLSASHEISVHKKLGERSYPFIAVRRDLLGSHTGDSAA